MLAIRSVAVFLIVLAVYAALAGGRRATQTADAHFIFQARAWLNGRLAIEPWPAAADDPAVVEYVALDDGTVVRGRRLLFRDVFHGAGGEEIPLSRVRETRRTEHHVAFPPFPAVVYVPLVVPFGAEISDAAVTVVAGALAAALCLVACSSGRRSRPSTRRSQARASASRF